MTLAYACLLVVLLLPYVWTVVAKASAPHYDNRDPRGWLARQDNPRVRRANAAQQNAFEALPGFIAAVLVAQLAGVRPAWIGWLALAFVVFRVLHGLFYVANNHRMRSMVWFGGLLCVLALLVLALVQAVSTNGRSAPALGARC